MFQVACLFLPFSHWFWLGLSVMSLKYPGYWWSEPPKLNQSAFYTRIFFFNWNRRVLFPLWFYYYKKASPRVPGEVTELQLHSDSQPQKEGCTPREAGQEAESCLWDTPRKVSQPKHPGVVLPSCSESHPLRWLSEGGAGLQLQKNVKSAKNSELPLG